MAFDTDSALSTFEKEALPHKSLLYRAAFSLLGTRGEAEEAVQETYFQAWKSFPAYERGTNCRGWMFSILFNVVRRQRRKWAFRFCMSADPAVLESIVPKAPFAITNELADPQILAALRKLPESYAEAVILADVEEFSYKEISEVTGWPIGTVMSRISRGRELLRQALAPLAEKRGILPTRKSTARK